VARPEQVDVWVGLDVGKEDHFAEVLDDAGERIFARGVANDEAALEALLDRAGKHGTAPGDRPAGLDRPAHPGRHRTQAGTGGLCPGTGDAPRG
jgi:hypothetical protein